MSKKKNNRPQIKVYDQTREICKNLNKRGELKLKHKDKEQKKKIKSGKRIRRILIGMERKRQRKIILQP